MTAELLHDLHPAPPSGSAVHPCPACGCETILDAEFVHAGRCNQKIICTGKLRWFCCVCEYRASMDFEESGPKRRPGRPAGHSTP